MTRLRDAASFRFTPHEPRSSLHRFQHIYALFFYAMFSLDYVFVRDFECFFFPTHDYLQRDAGIRRENTPILFAGKAFYLTYMLVLPVVVMRKARSLWLRLAFLLVHLIVGLTRLARFPNHAHDRQHLLSGHPQRV